MNQGEFLSMFSGVGAAVPNGADPIDAEEEARRLGISGPITTSLFKRWNTSARRQGLRVSAARKNEAPNNELVQVWAKLDAAARRFMALVEETEVSEFVARAVMPVSSGGDVEDNNEDDDDDGAASVRSRQRCFRSVKSATTYRNTIRA